MPTAKELLSRRQKGQTEIISIRDGWMYNQASAFIILFTDATSQLRSASASTRQFRALF